MPLVALAAGIASIGSPRPNASTTATHIDCTRHPESTFSSSLLDTIEMDASHASSKDGSVGYIPTGRSQSDHCDGNQTLLHARPGEDIEADERLDALAMAARALGKSAALEPRVARQDSGVRRAEATWS